MITSKVRSNSMQALLPNHVNVALRKDSTARNVMRLAAILATKTMLSEAPPDRASTKLRYGLK